VSGTVSSAPPSGSGDDLDVVFLTDGGQTPTDVLGRLEAFLAGATETLDLAVYDAHLDGPLDDRLIAALDAAEARGVRVRAVYNDEHRKPIAVPPPPEGPSALARLAAAVPSEAIPGIPDLMHHKYVIRDARDVWTGSTNWTADAWSNMENVIITAASADLAAAYAQDFEQLWTKRHVDHTGTFDDDPASMTFAGAPLAARVLFSPGRGRAMGQLVARRIGQARQRVRICSPVLTSAPVLATLAEVIDDHRCEVLITVDGPQMHEVLGQWAADGRAQWKAPLWRRIVASGCVAAKPSRAYQAGPPHDYMHAKLVVADDVVLTGSYNLSHSGEFNAENLLELQSTPLADRFTTFAEAVHTRYASASVPGQDRA